MNNSTIKQASNKQNIHHLFLSSIINCLPISDILITMSPPTLIARASSPVLRKNFSTTTPFLKTLASESAPATASSAKWRWSNLSPRTRRYILVGLAVGTCVDSYVVYNYWPRIFGSE
ncbi:hypothetical protein CEP51_012599 [Fusarium floridanum]|uniref:Uncharacterized protein n=1 Tax=Fusarium floridanum TaxID=1325733 RepID=A0A428QRK3_9HYPO|nr:hypothetical protein CEP51_012599 [Fusarium floridanum]